MEAYLDNAATTCVFPEVRDIMVRVMERDFANPSSRHSKGLDAETYIKEAAEQFAARLKCQPGEIIFTSGGTESNNMALFGTVLANRRAGKHIITTGIEHASVHAPFAQLEEMGYEASYLPVDGNGRLCPQALAEAVREDTLLVSVMMVNNEIGAWEDIQSLAAAAKEKNPHIIFHVDAIQAFGKYKIVPKRLGIDLMSVSGHKIHGPKGSGFLYVRNGVKVSPLLFGGGQQGGMRSGTENVPAIAGLGEAVRLIYQGHEEKREYLYRLKARLTDGFSDMDGVTVHGMDGLDIRETAPHIASVGFAGVRSEVMLHALEARGVYVSSGSACSSNHPALSGTLKAAGVPEPLLDSTLRFSFSVMTTEEEIDYALQAIREELPRLRRFVRK